MDLNFRSLHGKPTNDENLALRTLAIPREEAQQEQHRMRIAGIGNHVESSRIDSTGMTVHNEGRLTRFCSAQMSKP
jgi:hypothetical protein